MHHNPLQNLARKALLVSRDGQEFWAELKRVYLSGYVFGDPECGEFIETETALLKEGKRHLILEIDKLMKE